MDGNKFSKRAGFSRLNAEAGFPELYRNIAVAFADLQPTTRWATPVLGREGSL